MAGRAGIEDVRVVAECALIEDVRMQQASNILNSMIVFPVFRRLNT